MGWKNKAAAAIVIAGLAGLYFYNKPRNAIMPDTEPINATATAKVNGLEQRVANATAPEANDQQLVNMPSKYQARFLNEVIPSTRQLFDKFDKWNWLPDGTSNHVSLHNINGIRYIPGQPGGLDVYTFNLSFGEKSFLVNVNYQDKTTIAHTIMYSPLTGISTESPSDLNVQSIRTIGDFVSTNMMPGIKDCAGIGIKRGRPVFNATGREVTFPDDKVTIISGTDPTNPELYVERLFYIGTGEGTHDQGMTEGTYHVKPGGVPKFELIHFSNMPIVRNGLRN